jgi:ribose 5-phosphate isomerase RpiB
MRIAISLNHAGFELKEAAKAFLIEEKRHAATSGEAGSPSRPTFTRAPETPFASSLGWEIAVR